MNAYDTRRLIGVLGKAPRRSSFIRKMFFKGLIPPTGERKIGFDVDTFTKGISFFCHPLSEGKHSQLPGFSYKEFEPAYIKETTTLDPFRVLDRLPGEPLNGGASITQRQNAMLLKAFTSHTIMISNRLEVMAIEAVTTGHVTVSGEGIPTAIDVDFGRKASLTKSLSGSARWGQNGVSPFDNFMDWVRELAQVNGKVPNRAVFDPISAKQMRADPKFVAATDVNYKRATSGGTQGDTFVLDYPTEGIMFGAITQGGNTIELWEYQQQYEHPIGTPNNMWPDNTVMIGYEDPTLELSHVQAFGTIIDPETGYASGVAVDPDSGVPLILAPWHAFAKKPAIGEMCGTMCAPLMALKEKNANLCVKTDSGS